MPIKFNTEIITAAIQGFEFQKTSIDGKIAELSAMKLSAAGRAAIVAATKNRWALKRAEAAKAKTAAVAGTGFIARAIWMPVLILLCLAEAANAQVSITTPSTLNIQASAESGYTRVMWTAHGDWTANVDADWLSFPIISNGPYTSGTWGRDLTWVFNPTTQSRTGHLTVGTAVLTVTQAGKAPNAQTTHKALLTEGVAQTKPTKAEQNGNQSEDIARTELKAEMKTMEDHLKAIEGSLEYADHYMVLEYLPPRLKVIEDRLKSMEDRLKASESQAAHDVVSIIPPTSSVLKVGNGVSAPHLTFKVEPKYTKEARSKRIEGSVRLSVEIDPTGKPINIKVLSGLDSGLNEKAIEAVNQWRFAPGMKNGLAVTVPADITVTFRLP